MGKVGVDEAVTHPCRSSSATQSSFPLLAAAHSNTGPSASRIRLPSDVELCKAWVNTDAQHGRHGSEPARASIDFTAAEPAASTDGKASLDLPAKRRTKSANASLRCVHSCSHGFDKRVIFKRQVSFSGGHFTAYLLLHESTCRLVVEALNATQAMTGAMCVDSRW